jgi:hypothetical protein
MALVVPNRPKTDQNGYDDDIYMTKYDLIKAF